MFSDKAPYIVTVLMAGLAWALTHFVDRLLTTPMLRYEVQNFSSPSGQTQYLTFHNITRDKTFRKVRLTLTAPDDGVFTGAVVIPIQPASEGDTPYQMAGRTFEFTFPELQPGWRVEISSTYTGSSPPSLRLSSPDQTIYTVTSSFQTLLVQHELEALLLLAALWAVILFIVWILSGRGKAVSHDT